MISKYLIHAEFNKIENFINSFDHVTIKRSSDTNFFITIPLNDSFRAEICFTASSNRYSDSIKYYLEFEQVHGSESFIGIVPKKKLVPEDIINLGKYYDGRYHLQKGNSLSDAARIAIDAVLKNKVQLIVMCEQSTCWNDDGTLKHRDTKWDTEAILLGISKEYPVTRMFTGVQAFRQNDYDLCSGLHGSNGTYVENVNPEWILSFRVKRIGIECDSPVDLNVNVHEYITNKLMPMLGWERVTTSRLQMINQLVKGQKVKVSTKDMGVPPIYRRFYPSDKTCWDILLDEFLENI